MSDVRHSQCGANAAFYSDQSFRPSQSDPQNIKLSQAAAAARGREAVTDFLQVLSRKEVVMNTEERCVTRGKYVMCLSKCNGTSPIYSLMNHGSYMLLSCNIVGR